MPVILTQTSPDPAFDRWSESGDPKLDVNCQLAFERDRVDRSDVRQRDDKDAVMMRRLDAVSLWSHGIVHGVS
jgi:hypothetical protein